MMYDNEPRVGRYAASFTAKSAGPVSRRISLGNFSCPTGKGPGTFTVVVENSVLHVSFAQHVPGTLESIAKLVLVCHYFQS